jgi:hypothetical protein
MTFHFKICKLLCFLITKFFYAKNYQIDCELRLVCSRVSKCIPYKRSETLQNCIHYCLYLVGGISIYRSHKNEAVRTITEPWLRTGYYFLSGDRPLDYKLAVDICNLRIVQHSIYVGNHLEWMLNATLNVTVRDKAIQSEVANLLVYVCNYKFIVFLASPTVVSSVPGEGRRCGM